MAYKVIMPKQGLQMEEGTIERWLVKEGEEVVAGEPLFEIETDKVVITIDAEASGTLLKIVKSEGDTVPVAELVAVIGEPGEDCSALLIQSSTGTEEAPPAEVFENAAAVCGDVSTASIATAAATSTSTAATATTATAATATTAAAEDAPATAIASAAPAIASAAAETVGARGALASPRAKRLAGEHGIMLGDVSGTGQNGMVTEQDILAFMDKRIKQHKVFRPEDIKPFGDGDYQSRLLLDSFMAGEKCVNVNHGTFAPGAGVIPGSPGTGPDSYGAAHEKAEVYFGVYGDADVYIEGEPVHMARGTLVYIPGGVRHCVVNRSRTERFELLTIWADEKDNDMHAARVKAWGTSYKRVGD